MGRYGRITDPRHIDGPSLDPPDDGAECPECGGAVEQEGDKWEGSMWCLDDECGWKTGWDRIDEGLDREDKY